ncbi:MAG: thiamine diphosphokinase, partial [Bacteroidia bacterium]|nr:thiamine diphosphokinase [Bacteroidia bacterium]
DGALKRALSLGIRFDVLLGDFDSQLLPHEDSLPQPVRIVHTPDQEKPDLAKAIEFLINEGHKAVNILWATGRRSDHYMTNMSLLGRYNNEIEMVMIDDHSRIYPLKSGFRKQYPENSNISLIPLNKVENIITKNLVWNLNGQPLEYPQVTGSSNRATGEGIVQIDFDSGVLLMMECYDLDYEIN